MKITEHADLRALNTFAVPAHAALMATIESEEDLLDLPAFDPQRDYVLGDGSNVLFIDDIPGLLYRVLIAGKSIIERDGSHCIVEAGAGENWHDLVRWTVGQGLWGLENLSLIPGQAGSAPYQNIGAYGVELANVLESVTAWDWKKLQWAEIPATECGLGYRNSRFKSADRHRFLITSIRLRLHTRSNPQLHYDGLQKQLEKMNITQPDAAQISDAVMAIRREKLPDWRKQPNAGSFFKNPVMDPDSFTALQKTIPGLPHWPNESGRVKVPAARLIEESGLKGFRLGPAAVSSQHALVLTNTGGATGRDIQCLADHVQSTIHAQWGVKLEPEIQMIEFGDPSQ